MYCIKIITSYKGDSKMLVRRYINGKKVDVEVPNQNPPINAPQNNPQPSPIKPSINTSTTPKKRGCGCGRK